MSDQTVDLATFLNELKAQRAALDIQIAGIEARLGLEPSNGSGAAVIPPLAASGTGTFRPPMESGRVRPDEFFRMSIPEAVRHFLEIMKQPQAPTAIVSGLKAGGVLSNSKNFYTTVWTALKRLRAAGEIVNTPTGWGLSDWYPNKPKAGDEKKGRKAHKGRAKAKVAAKKAKASSSPNAPETASAKRHGGGPWHSFLSEQLKSGKSMAEAAAEWKKRRGEG